MTSTLSFAPLVPWQLIAGLAVLGLCLAGVALLRGGRGWALRVFALAVLAAALANPQAVREERQPQRDIAVIAVDRSASQDVGGRRQQTDAALAKVRERLSGFDDLDIRVIEVGKGSEMVSGSAAEKESGGTGKATDKDGGTRLFDALVRETAEIPRRRFAGAVLITDGQVHDVPDAGKKAGPVIPGPVHVLLTGKPGETDRRLVIEQAPGYGIVGKPVSIRYRIEDRLGKKAVSFTDRLAEVRLRYDDNQEIVQRVPVGLNGTFKFKLDHAGPTVVEISVGAAPGELSTVNNRALVKINGVRDRLRVLLVSGQPHAGERTWRNLMKSDPSVDLVHFTILRPPEKDDFTPLRELALIAFPIQELFEIKLPDFDLIVFDRYVVRDVLPPSYLKNIADFVHGGGALLLALGPEFASDRSLYQTPLGKIMPAPPTGRVLEGGFRPRLTETGRRHPVTAGLPGSETKSPSWGRWFRQIEAAAKSGQVLMRGKSERPLLLLERKGKGRVAELLSDHIWLWARDFEGGGPQAELLRRLSHWLMKEPDLEEESLKAKILGGRLIVERRSLKPEAMKVTVTLPGGENRTLELKDSNDGVGRAVMSAAGPGLYRVSDGTQTALATMGALNPLEFRDLRATDEKLRPTAKASGGGVYWIAQGLPDFRRTRPERDSSGVGWAGLTANRSFVISGLAQVPLLPGLLVMILVLGGLMTAWHREGR
ncbi:MAG: hypothetical protein ISR51_03115 [Rhodospirillales bacterium]|nr:hypothetical protein [Rhodospirillales bacterium]